jgi:hypothetical protein
MKNHHVPKISMLAMYLELPDSTMAKKASINPSDFLSMTYSDMIEAELDKVKNSSIKKVVHDAADSSIGKRKRDRDAAGQEQNTVAALSFRQPTALCGKASAIRASFGLPV